MTQTNFIVSSEVIRLMGIITHLEVMGCWYMAKIFREIMDAELKATVIVKPPRGPSPERP